MSTSTLETRITEFSSDPDVVTDYTQSSTSEQDVAPGTGPVVECKQFQQEMIGFKVFLLISQIVCLLLMITAVVITHIFYYPVAWTVTGFAVVELIIFIISVLHALRPSYKMLIIFLSFQVSNALAGIILALVVTLKDGGKECGTGPNTCDIFDITLLQRFHFFWFLMAKCTFALFLSLIAVAYSPQLHDYMAEDCVCDKVVLAGLQEES